MKRLDYKWMALSNTTLGMLMATINASILLIALPDVFRGIHLDPLAPGNTSYLLWLILGFLVVTAVLLVSLGRLGDIYGRARGVVPRARGGRRARAGRVAARVPRVGAGRAGRHAVVVAQAARHRRAQG